MEKAKEFKREVNERVPVDLHYDEVTFSCGVRSQKVLRPSNQELAKRAACPHRKCYKSCFMLDLISAYSNASGHAPPLTPFDRLFWAALRQLWPRWSDVLAIVKPETVVGWHRAGFRLYWRWRSRPCGGRPKMSEELNTHHDGRKLRLGCAGESF
jgi:hypothetical protein